MPFHEMHIAVFATPTRPMPHIIAPVEVSMNRDAGTVTGGKLAAVNAR